MMDVSEVRHERWLWLIVMMVLVVAIAISFYERYQQHLLRQQLTRLHAQQVRLVKPQNTGENRFSWPLFARKFPFPLNYWRAQSRHQLTAQWRVRYWPAVEWLAANAPQVPRHQFQQLIIERPANETATQLVMTLKLSNLRELP